jgi:hypothetical protein
MHRFLIGLAVLLALGVLVRLPFLPRLGHGYDTNAYRVWMGAIQDYGLASVFERTDTDYVGYHYILWALGKAYGQPASEVTVRDKRLRVWLKMPGLIGDLLAASLVAVIVRATASRHWPLIGRWDRHTVLARLKLSVADVVGLAAAALFLLHPAVLYAGSYWGQQDSLVAFFMLLACWLAWQRAPAWAGVALATGVLIKPQPLILGPLLAWVVWRQSSWPGLLHGGLAGAAVLLVGHAYFLLNGSADRIVRIYTFQLTQSEHLSFSAYNLWWPFERLAGARPNTAILDAGWMTVTYGLAATALVAGVVVLTWLALRREDAVGLMLAAGYFAAAYFLVAAGAHERYALPALIFLVPALAFMPRLRWPLLLFSAAITLNLLLGLPLDRRWPQGDPVWLTMAGSALAAVAVVGLTAAIPLRTRADGGAAERDEWRRPL